MVGVRVGVGLGVGVSVGVGVLVGAGAELGRSATTCAVQNPVVPEFAAVCVPVGPGAPSGLSARVIGLSAANCRRWIIPVGGVNRMFFRQAVHTAINQSFGAVEVSDGAVTLPVDPVCALLTSTGAVVLTPM